MKFTLLLFVLALKLKAAAKKNPAYRKHLGIMQLRVLIKTADDKRGRLFIFDKGAFSSVSGTDHRCDAALVWADAPSRFHAELAATAGADHIVTDGDIPGAARQVTGAESYKPLLGKNILMGGFTKIFDCVGHTDTLRAAMRAMAGGGTLSIVGIGDEVKLDLTPLWLKLQTIKGVYAHGVNLVDGRREHVFETALRFAAAGRMRHHEMVTHTFPITRYQDMIEVNMRKSANRAVKTAVSFI